MGLYNDVILSHFLSPRHTSPLSCPDAVGEAGVGHCGDRMRMELRFADGRIAEVCCRTSGCAVSIAAGSVAAERILGMTGEEALLLDADAIAALLGGLPEEKMHAAALAEDAIGIAVEHYQNRTE